MPGPLTSSLRIQRVCFPSSPSGSSRGVDGLTGSPQGGERFGDAFAIGDFEDDGFPDLAIGIPNEIIETGGGLIDRAGAVEVVFGCDLGLNQCGGAMYLTQGDDARPGDNFGASLAAGLLDTDSVDDLAVGSPNEDIAFDGTFVEDSGRVDVLLGGSVLFDVFARRSVIANDCGDMISGCPQMGGRFGSVLLVGETFEDVPDEQLLITSAGYEGAGWVHVVPWSFADNLVVAGAGFEDRPGLPATEPIGVAFGSALGLGDFDGDNDLDLIVGDPLFDFDDIGGGVWVANGDPLLGICNYCEGHEGGTMFTQREINLAQEEGGDRLGSAITP